MKTLTPEGINKQLVMLRESLSHAKYMLDGIETRANIFKVDINADTIRIFVYLDDTIVGNVKNISLVDKDGIVIAIANREFEKPATKGLYSVFSYKLVEVEAI